MISEFIFYLKKHNNVLSCRRVKANEDNGFNNSWLLSALWPPVWRVRLWPSNVTLCRKQSGTAQWGEIYLFILQFHQMTNLRVPTYHRQQHCWARWGHLSLISPVITCCLLYWTLSLCVCLYVCGVIKKLCIADSSGAYHGFHTAEAAGGGLYRSPVPPAK